MAQQIILMDTYGLSFLNLQVTGRSHLLLNVSKLTQKFFSEPNKLALPEMLPLSK